MLQTHQRITNDLLETVRWEILNRSPSESVKDLLTESTIIASKSLLSLLPLERKIKACHTNTIHVLVSRGTFYSLLMHVGHFLQGPDIGGIISVILLSVSCPVLTRRWKQIYDIRVIRHLVCNAARWEKEEKKLSFVLRWCFYGGGTPHHSHGADLVVVVVWSNSDTEVRSHEGVLIQLFWQCCGTRDWSWSQDFSKILVRQRGRWILFQDWLKPRLQGYY